MIPQQVHPVRTERNPSPLARHVDESPSAVRAGDSVALHRWARRQRSRAIGDLIARTWTVLAACTGRALDVLTRPAMKHKSRSNMI